MSPMFLSIVLLVNLNTAQLFVEHPELKMKIPVVVGKESTPTPQGIFLVERATHARLGRLLVFRKEDNAVWAIHENLPSRKSRLESGSHRDNYLSNGCIGVSKPVMDKLWATKQTIILQTY